MLLAVGNANGDTRVGTGVPTPRIGEDMPEVWVLAYLNPNDEHDNGVLGVYTTEQLARDAAIAKVIKWQPHLAEERVRWERGVLVKGDSWSLWNHYYVKKWEVVSDETDRRSREP